MAVSRGDAANGAAGQAFDDAGLDRGYERLLAVLGDDSLEAGRRLGALRQRLVRLFAWRGAYFPEDLADETLDRVANQLTRGLVIESDDPFRYVCGVAFRVFKESLRERQRWHRAKEALERSSVVAVEPDPDDDARLGCLEGCLEGLDGEKRELILSYYQGERSAKISARRTLAETLDIRPTTLRLRALRIREKLEVCVVRCLHRVA